MRWPEIAVPARMQRVAVVAPAATLRRVLAETADTGTVELDVPDTSAAAGEAAVRLRHLAAAPPEPRLSERTPDLDELERDGRLDLLAGEDELERHAGAAVVRGDVAALAGWARQAHVAQLAERLEPFGGTVVPLSTPRGVDPPTRLHTGGATRRAFAPLVETYGTVPYADVDPTLPAGLAYVFMFGMMFGDIGHGALLILAGLALRAGRPARLARYRRVWGFAVGAGSPPPDSGRCTASSSARPGWCRSCGCRRWRSRSRCWPQRSGWVRS
ncbi:V-type ATPase 116kDa subunit family protein [Prescottella defluvii]|nr:V-type ATPase 116kDa subunit family protein [Prescottella defluvii]